jgi:hypothetical protein
VGRVSGQPRALLASLVERWDERGHSPISRALASPVLTDDDRRQVSFVVRERLLGRLIEVLRERGCPNRSWRRSCW